MSLWTPPKNVSLLRRKAKEKVVTLPDGRRARVWIDDSGTVQQIESDEQLDAIVRPPTTTYRIKGE